MNAVVSEWLSMEGAIIPSEFARQNPEYTNGSRPFYWTEKAHKGRLKVLSSDGHTYHFSKDKETDKDVCYYRCEHFRKLHCSRSLIIDSKKNGKVQNNVTHVCKPSQDVICEGKKVG